MGTDAVILLSFWVILGFDNSDQVVHPSELFGCRTEVYYAYVRALASLRLAEETAHSDHHISTFRAHTRSRWV